MFMHFRSITATTHYYTYTFDSNKRTARVDKADAFDTYIFSYCNGQTYLLVSISICPKYIFNIKGAKYTPI